jgi:hypothetical protein
LNLLTDGATGNPELSTGAYMVIGAMAHKVAFSDTIASSLMDSIGQNARDERFRPALLCLAHLCESQEFAKLPSKCFASLVEYPGLLFHAGHNCLMRFVIAGAVNLMGTGLSLHK